MTAAEFPSLSSLRIHAVMVGAAITSAGETVPKVPFATSAASVATASAVNPIADVVGSAPLRVLARVIVTVVLWSLKGSR